MDILTPDVWNNTCIKINKMTRTEVKNWINTQSRDTLEKIYLHAKDVYYNKTFFDKRLILKDSHFDIIEDYLSINDVDTSSIGFEPTSNRETLPYFMPSMNKIKTSFQDVGKKIDKWLSKHAIPDCYVYSDKLDGVSGMYVYNSLLTPNKQHQLYTRGDGQIGTNISHLISKKYMPSLYAFKLFLNQQQTLSKLVIRGEFILPKCLFNSELHGASARNFVAGVINSKTIDDHHASSIDFVIYELIEPHNNRSFYENTCVLTNILNDFTQFSYANKLCSDTGIVSQLLKIKCVFYDVLTHDKINTETMTHLLEYRKQQSDYECDGIIIVHDAVNTSNDNKQKNEYKNPEYAFAFKHDDEELFVWTHVEDVIWNVSKHGLLKPTIKVSQITINNIQIEYTTGFNAAFIKNNRIGKNTRVCIKRSGDVIPVIIKVDDDVSSQPLMPSVDYTWNDTGVDILINECVMKNSIYYEKYVTKRLHYFTKTIGVKHLGEAIIEKCVYNMIDDIGKLCLMTMEDWLKVEGIKEKSATKIMEQLAGCLTNPSLNLATLMDASCCFGSSIGPKKLEKIISNVECKKYIIAYLTSVVLAEQAEHIHILSQLCPSIDDIGVKNTQELVNGLREFKIVYNSLLKTRFNKHIEKLVMVDDIATHTIKEKSKYNVVFTGFRNKELELSLETLGYSVGVAVSKNTKAVIVKDALAKTSISSKLKKAVTLNIPIYHQHECLKYLT
jgi:DNA ligase (NAD+)